MLLREVRLVEGDEQEDVARLADEALVPDAAAGLRAEERGDVLAAVALEAGRGGARVEGGARAEAPAAVGLLGEDVLGGAVRR